MHKLVILWRSLLTKITIELDQPSLQVHSLSTELSRQLQYVHKHSTQCTICVKTKKIHIIRNSFQPNQL